MKLAFVVQRYGLDIAGGAEYHCRLVAEHMARHAEVCVLTTCASDYLTWANHYPEGRELLNGIPVHRFKVKRPRDPGAFADWTDRAFRASHDPADELRWLEEQGPFSPRLVRYIERHRDDHDLFVFFSYRYYPTYHGLRAVRDKALLVPTCEEDGVYRLSIFPPFFKLPRAIVYNSVEERALIETVSGNQDVPGDVVGVGSALPDRLDAQGFRERSGLTGPYALYVGRIDENKGCRQLFDFFRRYRGETGSKLALALIGKPVIEIPKDAGIVHLGFLSDEEKWNALAASDLLIMPRGWRACPWSRWRPGGPSGRSWSTAGARCCGGKPAGPTPVCTTRATTNSVRRWPCSKPTPPCASSSVGMAVCTLTSITPGTLSSKNIWG